MSLGAGHHTLCGSVLKLPSLRDHRSAYPERRADSSMLEYCQICEWTELK